MSYLTNIPIHYVCFEREYTIYTKLYKLYGSESQNNINYTAKKILRPHHINYVILSKTHILYPLN